MTIAKGKLMNPWTSMGAWRNITNDSMLGLMANYKEQSMANLAMGMASVSFCGLKLSSTLI